MTEYKFSSEQKFALWWVYEGKCVYCHKPVRLADLTIDHILPEHLAQEPQELQRLIARYKLGAGFSINDYCNWLPAHFGCNARKGGDVFECVPFYVSIARRNVSRARQREQRTTRQNEADRALGVLGSAITEGLIKKGAAIRYLNSISQRIHVSYDPIVVTFGVNVSEARSERLFDEDAPTDYPYLCDWLEEDLLKQLKSEISCSFYYPEESARDGETLSVRLAFIGLDLSQLERFESSYWELLEVAYYSEIYGALPDAQPGATPAT